MNVVITPGAASRRDRSPLAFFHLDRLESEFAGNLSYGEQKPLEPMRVVMREPTLILLDEPAAGVYRMLLNERIEATRRLREEGRTILIVEQDVKIVMGPCERLFVLDYGEKISEGPPEAIEAGERVIEAYFGR
jgi:branched-chain amino acid transport system ATP-binding protein